MTNTLTISRELIIRCERVAHDAGFVQLAYELSEILAAPAVERQEPAEWRYRFTHRGELSKWFPVDSYMKLYNIGNDPAYEIQPLYTSPPAPVAVDDLQAIQDRHEAWMAGVEQGKAESELGAIKESEEFEKWRNAQIDVLIRNGYPEGAEAFRNLGSVQWAGWQARACLDKVKEMNR